MWRPSYWGAELSGARIVGPRGDRVYVSNGCTGSVSVIDADKQQVVATVPVGQRPWNMALMPDGARLYVACGRSNAVAVVDTHSATKVREVAVGELPWGVALTPA